MAKRSWLIYISPVHGVRVFADTLEIVQNILVFKRGAVVCAQFSQHLGWEELLEENPAKDTGQVLQLVPKPTGPAGDAA